ncbi:MAG TPA: SGNH/GDSL hydrolase family protein [Jiangellales bacterium]|nr:SGNH/GDSL hydrolase family protein [Jiangellales bacterium]
MTDRPVPSRTRRLRIVLGGAAALAFVGGSLAGALPAAAAEPTAIVAMGDSFISGEAAGSYTDRNLCHRSAVAEIAANAIAVDAKLNLACSGAKINDFYADGFKGERAQLAQLEEKLESYDVEMVVVSVIANDVGFASLVTDCATRWVLSAGACSTAQDRVVTDRLAANEARLATLLVDIDAAMQRGDEDRSYQLVVQTYTSPINERNRFSSAWRLTFGCPFYEADHRWAYGSVVPQFAGTMARAARAANSAIGQPRVSVLDLNTAFAGREVCAPGATVLNEWVRGIDFGDLQQSMHPNSRGHRAMGACLQQVYGKPVGEYSCYRASSTTSTLTLRTGLAPATGV